MTRCPAAAPVRAGSHGKTRLWNAMVRLTRFTCHLSYRFFLAKSSLPVVRHAVHNERVAADSRMDRMAIWMRNVEREFLP
jgi:hypothetical protein